jgi:hypothetical protein
MKVSGGNVRAEYQWSTDGGDRIPASAGSPDRHFPVSEYSPQDRLAYVNTLDLCQVYFPADTPNNATFVDQASIRDGEFSCTTFYEGWN